MISIATIVKSVSTTPELFEDILILSGDKDFIQLQKFENVKQYSPTTKKYVDDLDPKQYVFEHIIKGDKGYRMVFLIYYLLIRCL